MHRYYYHVWYRQHWTDFRVRLNVILFLALIHYFEFFLSELSVFRINWFLEQMIHLKYNTRMQIFGKQAYCVFTITKKNYGEGGDETNADRA